MYSRQMQLLLFIILLPVSQQRITKRRLEVLPNHTMLAQPYISERFGASIINFNAGAATIAMGTKEIQQSLHKLWK